MRGDRDDGGSAGPASSALRTAGLVAGFLLAAGATAVVFLTEDPRLLRLAVVAAAWAFVLAALVASRRSAGGTPADGGERVAVERADLERAAADLEVELRLAHEREREAAARREHELQVEGDLRRAAEQSMRAELAALRRELAQVAELRREMGQVAELRRELAEVAGLRRDLAGLAELRTALAGIDPTALAELRTDVGRLRRELTEQLSGEMLVERVMLRTQSTRSAPAVEPGSWEGPAPELTTAWPAARADGPAVGSRPPAEVRIESRRPAPPPPAGRSRLDPALPPSVEPGPRWRRADDPSPTAAPAADELPAVQRPVSRRERPPVPAPVVVAPSTEAPGEPARWPVEPAAESGPTPPSGGRRRRRYREDGETDDVLSRVLGR